MDAVTLRQGTSPLVLAFPHAGTSVPEPVWQALNATGRKLADTDWHIDALYDGLQPDASWVQATFHRYVIDANRDPEDASLYPGQNTTGLVPLTDFDGKPIWRDGSAPSSTEVKARTRAFHAPYHAALAAEIARVRSLHGIAIVFDCHSIRSHIPFLFDGRLPDFNIGTNSGRSCDPAIEAATAEICSAAAGYSSVRNGRFKGGWTTRHYGQPQAGVHAIQMELAQSAYLASEAPPWDYSTVKAERLRPVLTAILTRLSRLAKEMAHHG